MVSGWQIIGNYIKKPKAFYFGIGNIKCPALGGEEITFDQRVLGIFCIKVVVKEKANRRSNTQIQASNSDPLSYRKFKIIKW